MSVPARCIRRSWTYLGVPELRNAYEPPFADVPRISLPYLTVQLASGAILTPRLEARLSSSDPYCVFPRDVFVQLAIPDHEGIRARDPHLGEIRLVLLELRVHGEGGAVLTTRARMGRPLERDVAEPVLGSFGFFSAFHVSFSPARGIFVRGRRPDG